MRILMDGDGQLVAAFGDALQPPGTFMIPEDLAEALGLSPGEVLPIDAQAAVREGDWSTLVAAFPDVDLQSLDDSDELPDEAWEPRGGDLPADVLPLAGRWQYRVVALTELGGFATANGTANRMEQILNSMGEQGWELAIANDRAARYIKGESLLLTFRRFVTTESDYIERIRAEERLRRVAVQSLDATS